jgi:hypothetical protein
MTKLHELLAAETNLETQAMKCRTDLVETFTKRRHHFEEKKVVFTPNTEGEQVKVEAQSDIQTSVTKELAWIKGHMVKALDASYQVAETNTKARADVILEDDTVLLKAVPATALLELEKRAVEVQQLIASIPTLDPAKGFQPDPQKGAGIYKARDVVKTRTKKDPKVVVKYEATKEHPAQTELVVVDKDIGTLAEQEWSSLISPAEKAELLDRAEMLIRALKRARSRANDAEVDNTKKLGSQLLSYVFEGKK